MKKVFLFILLLCTNILITSTTAFAYDEVNDLSIDSTKNIDGSNCSSKNTVYTVPTSTSTSALQTAELLWATPPLPEAGEIASREEQSYTHFEKENAFNNANAKEEKISLSQERAFNEKDLNVKEKNTTQTKLGLALSGGGALGFAHIGAIQALEEHGIKPDYVSGSSMGAIIGVIYAAGYSTTEIMKIIKDEKLYKLEKLMSPNLSLKKQGLSSHATLRTTLQEMLPHDCFDSLKIPFAVCVTNITSGESEFYFSGEGLVEWVVASASIPGVFNPIIINDTSYVDGGVLNNLPAKILHDKGCNYIIGVDVLPFLDVQKSSIMDIALWSIRLMQHSNTIDDSKYCNWLIFSEAIREYNEFNFDKYKEIYQYGYKAMTDYIHSHPEMIETITGKSVEHHHPTTTNTMKQIAK
ncbi:MAG: patatin-like phospholipase family protein [Candidatus Aphodosoma sp.]